MKAKTSKREVSSAKLDPALIQRPDVFVRKKDRDTQRHSGGDPGKRRLQERREVLAEIDP